MADPMRTRSGSRVILLGAIIAAASALVLLAAPVGYRLGLLSVRVALTTVLRWGAYGALAGAAVSLAGLVWTLARGAGNRRGVLLAGLGILPGMIVVAVLAPYRTGPPAPPIHDISTDTEDPPPLVAVLRARADAPNPAEYGGPGIASQQRDAYPDIGPIQLNATPAQAFDRALATAREMGWDVIDVDPSAGRIEATDSTFWFGFKDDVVIRLRPAGGGTRVDVRSVSRVGRGDAGTNARRIRAFLNRLQG